MSMKINQPARPTRRLESNLFIKERAKSLRSEVTIDRLALRRHPSGPSMMRQYWGKLLFMHWAIDPELLRPLIPSQLSIDTLDGKAWIGVVPFTMWGIRASFLPPIPGTSAFHELNVRTYVHYQGVPGVWFFSLDAASKLAVWARALFITCRTSTPRCPFVKRGTRSNIIRGARISAGRLLN